MHLLSLIIGVVLIGYILFNAIRNRRNKKNTKSEVFEEIILEKTQSQFQQIHKKLPEGKSEHDPLLEDYAKEALKVVAPISKTQEPEQDVREEFELSVAELPDLQEEQVSAFQAELNEAPKEPDFIAITILPKQNSHFSGKALISAFHKHQFRFGKQSLYHRHLGDDPAKAVLYSIASIVEPGYFEQETILKSSFPGLILFMFASNEIDPVNTFEKMLTNARQLVATLNAELCDIKRQPLTTQTLMQIRDKIKENTAHAAMRGQQSW
ncbi:MAG: hypothetical protein BGO43_02030 [Gammaproteobacteria bacterium 39-13]|nr:cell division protein ZipA C-terminal FtsZ-binding domain-containing protein [Gammaproteobacteria bacterium]OJV91860.1 MAG: hypothetical protein BGO43_02030 [Gammaproteobacteria bacterium 39-13]